MKAILFVLSLGTVSSLQAAVKSSPVRMSFIKTAATAAPLKPFYPGDVSYQESMARNIPLAFERANIEKSIQRQKHEVTRSIFSFRF